MIKRLTVSVVSFIVALGIIAPANMCVEAKSEKFTTLCSQDFESIAVGTSDAALASEAGFSLTSPNPGTVKVVSANGSNRMELSSVAGPDTYHQIDFTFPQSISSGVIETSMKTDIYNLGAGAHAFLGVLNGGENRGMLSVFGNWYYFPADNLNGVGNQPGPAKNAETGMYHLRTVIYREGTSGDWTAMIFDDGGSEPSLLYSTTISAATHQSITGIRLTNNWPVGGEQKYAIDDIRIDYYKNAADYSSVEEFEEYQQDFEDIESGTSGSDLANEAELTFGGNMVPEIINENGKNKLLLKGGTPPDVYTEVSFLFPAAITEGIIETKLDFEMESIFSGAHAFLGVLNSAKLRPLISAYASWSTYPATEGNPDGEATAAVNVPSADVTTGIYSLRSVIYRDNAGSDWTAMVYDDGGDEPTLLYTTTISSGTHPSITGIRLVNTWPMEASQILKIDNIAINYRKIPYVQSSNCENAPPTCESLILELSNEPDNKDFDIKVTQKDDGTLIDTSFEYDEETNKVTVMLGSFLDYDTEYEVTFDGAKIRSYEFKTEKAPVTVTDIKYSYGLEGGTETDVLPDGAFSGICDVTVERSLNSSNVLIILAAYDKNGTITKLGTSIIPGGDLSGRAVIEGLTGEKAKELHAFVWEQNESGFHKANNKTNKAYN